jgi:phage tail sheath protein FI
MMLRTIATSDQKSYQWFAPAGTRRGGVDNASSVGYLDANNEFHTTALPESLRSVLASVKINPIATLTGVGVVNMGQYTRAKNASSLDRINVARLVAFLRRQMGILAKPYLFEPNDKITRNEIKRAAESLLLELVGQRALYDFIVVCDESNNTPSRIDRSELWLDVAIEPVKAVEFIYIPLRLKNTGEIKAGV